MQWGAADVAWGTVREPPVESLTWIVPTGAVLFAASLCLKESLRLEMSIVSSPNVPSFLHQFDFCFVFFFRSCCHPSLFDLSDWAGLSGVASQLPLELRQTAPCSRERRWLNQHQDTRIEQAHYGTVVTLMTEKGNVPPIVDGNINELRYLTPTHWGMVGKVLSWAKAMPKAILEDGNLMSDCGW